MKLTSVKTDIVVKYSPILNMSSIGRKIGAPHLQVGNAKIENDGRPAEKIILMYSDREYIVAYDWTGIQFSSTKDRSDHQSPSGPTRTFFDILDTIRTLDEFGRIKQVTLRTIDIAENHLSSASEFRRRYLAPSFPIADQEIEDYAIDFLQSKSGQSLHVNFGPFVYERDVESKGLRLFDNQDLSWLASIKGILFILQNVQINPLTFDHGTLKQMLSANKKLIQQCL